MPDQNDQHAQALIEALAPKLIEAILPKIAESVEAQIGGIKKKNDELLGKLADTKKPDSIAAIDNLIDNDLRWLLRRLRQSIEEVGEDNDKLLELAQMREMRHTLESLGKLRGMFSQKIDVQIDLGSSPQFILLRQIILRVLDQHPEAKADFLREMNVLKVIEQ